MLALVALLALAYGVASSGRGFVAASPATWARAVDQRGRWVVDLAAIIAALGVALAWARISLAPSITVAASRVIVLSSWAMTRGAGAPILLACLGVAAAPGALMWTIGGFFHPSMASRLAQGCVLGGLWFPQSVGLMAFFQSRLGLSPARVSPPQ